jgi:hypothetical protein
MYIISNKNLTIPLNITPATSTGIGIYSNKYIFRVSNICCFMNRPIPPLLTNFNLNFIYSNIETLFVKDLTNLKYPNDNNSIIFLIQLFILYIYLLMVLLLIYSLFSSEVIANKKTQYM